MNLKKISVIAALACALPASADTGITINASADGAVQFSGVLGFSVDDTGTQITTSRSGGNNVRHGVYEFPIGSIPAGSTITSATLHLTTQGLLSNVGSADADLFFHAYAGDGVITDSDHGNNTAGTLVAEETYATGGGGVPGGTTLDISFDDIAVLQNALDGGATHLSVRSQTVNFVTFRVFSLEGGVGAPIFPQLDVTYVPTPSTAVLLGFGGVLAVRRRR